ncbi:hypothetical protein LFM09_36660 [Lentzea alba]|uniref:hypothetical protein n=1 Tax=Lentzea alba TaxID=2714351 RepID=UPI0039BFA255
MWPFDDIGNALGGPVRDMIVTGFEAAMLALWRASLFVLQAAFGLADKFSVFTVDARSGPVSILWPMMLWISGVLALGLFFWQLTATTLRGGRGFLRLVGGPVQYGVALALTVGIVAAFLAGVDGLTSGILKYGLRAENFTDALNATGFLDAAGDGVNATVLGIAALIGVIPAGIGYVLEMLFREAAVYVMVATVPVSAAGLLSGITASWFWRTCRWLMVCVAMKAVLAMTLVLGIAISGGSQGLSGLLAGVGVLIISLCCPFVLFRLFAFVDPNSDAGAAFRDALSGAGVDSYGENNPAALAASGARGGGGGGGSQEDANTGRFDEAAAEYAEQEMDETGVGQSSSSHSASQNSNQDNKSATSGDDSSGAGSDEPNPDDDDHESVPPAANTGSVVSSSPNTGPSGHYGAEGEGGGEAAAGAEEAAVIV